MFAIIQYPFIDTRLLNTPAPTDSFFPHRFPKPIDKSLYFRFLGSEKLRRSAEGLPKGERTYFASKAAVTLLPGAPLRDGVFTRLYADELSLHFDAGFHGSYTGAWDSFLREFLETPRLKVTSRFLDKEHVFAPYSFFDELLRIYQYATRSKKAEGDSPRPIHAGIIPGMPAVMISYRPADFEPPPETVWLNLPPGLRAGCCLFNWKEHPIAVYLIERGLFGWDRDEVRRLRICISKIHAYKETLRLLLDHIDRGGVERLDQGMLSRNLNKLLKLTQKRQYYGLDNQDFWGLAYSIDRTLHGGQWIELADRAEETLTYLRERPPTVIKHYHNKDSIMVTDSDHTEISGIEIRKK